MRIPAAWLVAAVAKDRDHAAPAGADAGRRAATCRCTRSWARSVPRRTRRVPRAGVLRPGAAAGLRVQPRRGARAFQAARARPELRRLLLGRGADARAQHQRADDAGGQAAARAALERRWRWRTAPAPTERALIEALAEALLGRTEGRARGARRGVRRRDEAGGGALSGRRRSSTLYAESAMERSRGILGRRRREAEGPRRRDRLARWRRCSSETRRIRARTISTSTRSRRRRKPQRALPCAERLAALMPGAGHMVHMPAHIYYRVGRTRGRSRPTGARWRWTSATSAGRPPTRRHMRPTSRTTSFRPGLGADGRRRRDRGRRGEELDAAVRRSSPGSSRSWSR